MAKLTSKPTVESTARPASKCASKPAPARTVQPYRDGKGWAMRRRIQGHNIYVSGHDTRAGAKKAMGAKVSLLLAGDKAKGLGPHHTTVGQAMQDYAAERLIFLKRARQEANRISRLMRAAGLATLNVPPLKASVAAVVRELGVPHEAVATGTLAIEPSLGTGISFTRRLTLGVSHG